MGSFNGVFSQVPATKLGSLAIAEALLRPACDCIQLNLTQAVRVHPGERAQAPHRDEEMWPASKQAHWLINVMWAVSDFSDASGESCARCKRSSA